MDVGFIFLFFLPYSIKVNHSPIEGKSSWLGEVGWSLLGVFVVLLLEANCLTAFISMLLGLCHFSPMEVETFVELTCLEFDWFLPLLLFKVLRASLKPNSLENQYGLVPFPLDLVGLNRAWHFELVV